MRIENLESKEPIYILGLALTRAEAQELRDDLDSLPPAAEAVGSSTNPSVLSYTPSAAWSPSNWGGEFLDDAIRSPVVRPVIGNRDPKIPRQVGQRGWTPTLIDAAVLQGRSFSAVNKLGGANTPATRYVYPWTGQSVVIDNTTGEVIHVGRPGFRN